MKLTERYQEVAAYLNEWYGTSIDGPTVRKACEGDIAVKGEIYLGTYTDT